MSEEIIVEVPIRCDRTEKVSKVKMTMEEVADHHAGRQRKSEQASMVKETLESMTDDSPDLVVMFRGQVVVLPYINPKADDAVLRLLHDLTRNDVFPKPVAKKRAKKGAAKAKAKNGSTTTQATPAPAQ